MFSTPGVVTLLFVRHWSQLFRCPPEQLFRSALKFLVDCVLEFFQFSPQQLGIPRGTFKLVVEGPLECVEGAPHQLGIVLRGSQLLIVRAPNSSSVHSSGAASSSAAHSSSSAHVSPSSAHTLCPRLTNGAPKALGLYL
ncbi:hypothetical protein B0H13DRAFT_2307814 [Mycena leptocephala]|nr:hypothetical protein B0H13DRAFT_2307814 [Mycena leptocephala]